MPGRRPRPAKGRRAAESRSGCSGSREKSGSRHRSLSTPESCWRTAPDSRSVSAVDSASTRWVGADPVAPFVASTDAVVAHQAIDPFLEPGRVGLLRPLHFLPAKSNVDFRSPWADEISGEAQSAAHRPDDSPIPQVGGCSCRCSCQALSSRHAAALRQAARGFAAAGGGLGVGGARAVRSRLADMARSPGRADWLSSHAVARWRPLRPAWVCRVPRACLLNGHPFMLAIEYVTSWIWSLRTAKPMAMGTPLCGVGMIAHVDAVTCRLPTETSLAGRRSRDRGPPENSSWTTTITVLFASSRWPRLPR